MYMCNHCTSLFSPALLDIPTIAENRHDIENVYFSMAKETLAFALWEKLQSIYEKKSPSSKLILI